MSCDPPLVIFVYLQLSYIYRMMAFDSPSSAFQALPFEERYRSLMSHTPPHHPFVVSSSFSVITSGLFSLFFFLFLNSFILLLFYSLIKVDSSRKGTNGGQKEDQLNGTTYNRTTRRRGDTKGARFALHTWQKSLFS